MRMILKKSIPVCSMERRIECEKEYNEANQRTGRTNWSLHSILDAGNDGSINTFIVNQALTYGVAEGPLPSLGVGYKILTGNAQSLGFVPYIGDGSALLSVVS